MPTFLRAHDYRHLIERWRAVAKRAGIPLRRLVRADGYDLYSLVTPGLAATRTHPPCEVQPRSQARSEVQLRNEASNGDRIKAWVTTRMAESRLGPGGRPCA